MISYSVVGIEKPPLRASCSVMAVNERNNILNLPVRSEHGTLFYLKPTHYGHCVVLFMPKTHSLGFRLSPTEIEYVTRSVTVAGMSGMSWV